MRGAAQSANVTANQYAVVYIWRPKNKEHSYGSSVTLGSVGHVALLIQDDADQYYLSFWPDKSKKRGLLAFQGKFHDTPADDLAIKKELPDSQIVLYSLDIKAMVAAVKKIQTNHAKNPYTWRLNSRISVAEGESKSCGTKVWHVLDQGGILKYYKPNRKGPKKPELRKKYLCDKGQLFWGLFDDAFWRDWIASPVLLLHLVASVKEQELNKFPITSTYDSQRGLPDKVVADSALVADIIFDVEFLNDLATILATKQNAWRQFTVDKTVAPAYHLGKVKLGDVRVKKRLSYVHYKLTLRATITAGASVNIDMTNLSTLNVAPKAGLTCQLIRYDIDQSRWLLIQGTYQNIEKIVDKFVYNPIKQEPFTILVDLTNKRSHVIRKDNMGVDIFKMIAPTILFLGLRNGTVQFYDTQINKIIFNGMQSDLHSIYVSSDQMLFIASRRKIKVYSINNKRFVGEFDMPTYDDKKCDVVEAEVVTELAKKGYVDTKAAASSNSSTTSAMSPPTSSTTSNARLTGKTSETSGTTTDTSNSSATNRFSFWVAGGVTTAALISVLVYKNLRK